MMFKRVEGDPLLALDPNLEVYVIDHLPVVGLLRRGSNGGASVLHKWDRLLQDVFGGLNHLFVHFLNADQ